MVASNAFILTEMKEKAKAEETDKFRKQQAERAVRLLSKRFGELDGDLKVKIQDFSKEKLDSIIDNILDIESLDEI